MCSTHSLRWTIGAQAAAGNGCRGICLLPFKWARIMAKRTFGEMKLDFGMFVRMKMPEK